MWNSWRVLGRVLGGRYRIARELGQGALANAFAAEDLVSSRTVALKLVRSRERAALLHEEFSRLRGLHHPHLVRALDFGADPDGAVYYTADLVAGLSLDRWLETGRPWALARRIFTDALDALGFLHALEIRHGDFKPANVLVDPSGRGTLIDLSSAQRFSAVNGGVSGTPGFLAPELVRGEPSAASPDLFAAGVTLARVAERCSGVPDAVLLLARRLRSESPANRPASVAEVLELLGERATSGPPRGRAPRLLGRDAAIARFDAILDGFSRGSSGPRVCVLEGADGSGRTRLLEELKWRAQSRTRVVHGGQTITGLLSRARDMHVASSVSGLVRAHDAAGDRVVIVLDDVHRLPEPERVLAEAWIRLCRRDATILTLCASRPRNRDDGAVSIPLEALGTNELAAWSDGLLAADRVPDLERATGGLPAYVEGVLARIAAGEISESDLRTVGASGRALGIDSLAPRQVRALGLLALVERADPRTCGIEPEVVRDLQRTGWIVDDEAGLRLARAPEGPLLIREIAPDVLVELRRAGAELLRAAGREPDAIEQLALSGDRAAARDAFVACAADHSARPRAWIRAAASFGDPRSDYELGLAIAAVFELAGELSRALGVLARLLRRRPEAPWRTRCLAQVGSACLKMGRARRSLRYFAAIDDHDGMARAAIQLGRHREAFDHAMRGLARDPAGAALHESAGLAAAYLGELETAHHHFASARALEPDASPRSRMRLVSYEAIAEFRAGRLAVAAAKYAEALEIASAYGLDDQLASAAANLGTTYQQHGDFGLALEAYERGLRAAGATAKRSTEVALEFNRANLWAAVGLFDRAEAALARIDELHRSLGLRYFDAAADSLRGEIAFWRDQTGAAAALFERARAAFEAEGLVREVAEMDLHLGECAVRAGSLDDATDRAARAAAAARSLRARDLAARAAALRGSCCIRADRSHEAIPILEQGLEVARACGERPLEAELLARLAAAFDLRGADSAGRAHRQAARDVWDRIGASLPREIRGAFDRDPRRAALFSRPQATGEDESRAREPSMLSRLLEINRRLNSTFSSDAVLAHAIDSAIELTGAERGFVLVRGAKKLEVAAARNVDRERIGRSHLKFSRGIAETVVETGELIVAVDAMDDARFAANQSVHAMQLRSVVCVPIRGPDELYGAIYLDNRFERGRFASADVRFLLGFADQVAIALRNARLYTALEARTRELESSKAHVEELLRGREQEIGRLESEVRTAREEGRQYRYEYRSIVGRSASMRKVLATLDRVIDSSLSVLLQGESGTGKELVARAIHSQGSRQKGRFIALNCAAVPEALLESELFGHVRGAFTGADGDRDGLLVAATGGTLFLDEVGEMTPAMQAKLLRALQEREVRPVGSSRQIPIDARIVSATNRPLRSELGARFREDLFYRLAVVEITLPPLRERLEDLPELARAILGELAAKSGRALPRIEGSAMAALTAHAWPGNVRELVNVLSRALAFADDRITVADLALAHTPRSRADARESEQHRIRAALEASAWNVAEVSRALGIPRNTLYRKLKLHRLDRPPRKAAEER